MNLKLLYEPISILLSYNEYLVNQLSNEGLEVYLDKPGNHFANLMYIYEKLRGRLKGNLLMSYFMPNFERNRYLKRLAKKIHLVHLNGLNIPLETLQEFKKFNKPILFVLHTAPIDLEVYSVLNEVVDLYVAPSYFTLSQESKKLNKRTKVKVIYHGIDTNEFKPIPKMIARRKFGLPMDKKIILWNDRISPEKDIEVLLKAIPLVLREHNDCYFYIKGRAVNKDYWKKIKSLIKNLPTHAFKLHMGWFSHSKLPYLYNAADALLRTQKYENFGLAFIESMACGTPVVAQCTATAPEVLGDTALLYREGDHEDLADKILKLIYNKDLAEELSRRARDRVLKYFTAERMAKDYLSVYHELIK